MPFRRFAPEDEDTARLWFENPIQTLPVAKRGDFTQNTATGACQVALPNGSIGYVKPRPDRQDNATVAREKLAADLAHILKLPVPPVLVRRPMSGWPYFTALSLSVLSSPRDWGDGGLGHIQRLCPALEALRAFWSWIMDTDHNGNPGNVLFEITGTHCAVVGIDHTYAFNHAGGLDVLTHGPCQGYGTATLAAGTVARQHVLSEIEALGEDSIAGLVTRLGELLSQAQQDAIIALLQSRRGELRKLLAA